MAFISKISITCFVGCYLIALGLEVARLLFRRQVPARAPAIACLIGWVTQSLYLIAQTQDELADRAIAPLSSWYDFCLLTAWFLAGAYLGLSLRRPDNAFGAFFLPLVLAAIGVAIMFRDAAPFPAGRAVNIWRIVHGMTLLLGTTAVVFGFATGLMYLLQSYRLKHKLPPGGRFRLPTLEWLQKFNREALILSTCFLAIGLLSGVVLKLIGAGNVAWHDPVVLSSGVLFLWLVVVTVFESVYKPARQGQKVAYLTLANFVFLGLALYFVLFGSHASAPATAHPTSNRSAPAASNRIDISSPGGTTYSSLGRKPQERRQVNARSPSGATLSSCGPSSVSPLRGLANHWPSHLGLAPQAIICRRSATEDAGGAA